MGNGASPTSNKRNRSKWFSSRIIFAPFGRYQGDKPADESADGLLIGREEQRAQLITALLDNTHRGAYLVTGLRGSGKTTLVKHCLKEYEEAAYERYLNRHVGRSLLWDRLALFVFTCFILFALLMLHDVLKVLMGSGLGFEPFLALVILAIVAILLIPFLMAWNTLSFVGECAPKIYSKGLTKFLLFSAVTGLSFALIAVAQNYLSVLPGLLLLVAVSTLPIAAKVSIRLIGKSRHCFQSMARAAIIFGLVALASVVAFSFSSDWAWYLFGIQLLLLAMITNYRKGEDAADHYNNERGGFYKATFGALGLLGTGAIWLSNPRIWSYGGYFAICGILAIWIGAGFPGANSRTSRSPEERPLLLLVFKGMALLLLGLHLIAPAWEYVGAIPEFSNRFRILVGHLPQQWSRSVISPSSSAWEWIFSSAALMTAIFFLEFEWIARSRARFRRDRVLVHRTKWKLGILRGGTTPVGTRRPGKATVRFRQWLEIRTIEKRLFELTFFHSIFRHWNPLLVVPVNLGFDALDHRRVIEAMLTCLQEQYEKSFISWRSPIESAKKVSVVLLSLYLTFALSFHAFHINRDSHRTLAEGTYCRNLAGSSISSEPPTSAPPGMLLSCWIGGERLARLAQTPILYRSPSSATNPNSNSSAPANPGPAGSAGQPDSGDEPEGPVATVKIWEPGGIRVTKDSLIARSIQELGDTSPDRSTVLVIRAYHVIFLLIILGSFQVLYRKYWPYYNTAVQLRRLLQSLTGRMREDSIEAQSIWSRILNVFAGRERARLIEADPSDPRAIEVATLGIMAKMQSLNLAVPYTERQVLNLPAPEIIFKLDELDKLGVSVIPEHNSSGPEVEPNQGLDLERRRSKALHNLFAEMKNILSSGVARFIFIGGGNLHDEWLADLSSRRPLLGNIFEVELHLPSLLTEAVEEKGTVKPNTNIQWFLEHLFQECKRNQERSNTQRMSYVHQGPLAARGITQSAKFRSVRLRPARPTASELRKSRARRFGSAQGGAERGLRAMKTRKKPKGPPKNAPAGLAASRLPAIHA